MTVDARNFLLNTDYPLDKIIYITSGNATVPNGTTDGGSTGIVIPHGLPFTPLPILLWSNTSDFAITNEEMDDAFVSTYFTTGGTGQIYSIQSDSTNIGISRTNTSGSSKTFYYRIFCFQPSNADVNSVVPSTSTIGDSFVLNTDYNYMKLFHAGILTSSSPTYTHNLGYIPRVQVWSEFSDGIVFRTIEFQDISTDPTGSGGKTGGMKLTTTTIEMINYTPDVHYRIYCDA